MAFSYGLFDNAMFPSVSDGRRKTPCFLFFVVRVYVCKVALGVRPSVRVFGTSQAHFAKLIPWKPAKEDVILSTFPKAGRSLTPPLLSLPCHHLSCVFFPGTHLMGQMVLQTLHDGKRDFETWNTELVLLEFERANPDLCENPRVMNASNYKVGRKRKKKEQERKKERDEEDEEEKQRLNEKSEKTEKNCC